MFIHMTAITFNWKEGDELDLPSPLTVHKWSEADQQLRQWAALVPEDGGYDKTSFTVRWSDGGTHEGRFDLEHTDMVKRATVGLLADHMLSFLRFYTGLHKPSHLTQAQYDSYMTPAETAETRQHINTHLFRDCSADNDYWWEFDDNFYPSDTITYLVEPTPEQSIKQSVEIMIATAQDFFPKLANFVDLSGYYDACSLAKREFEKLCVAEGMALSLMYSSDNRNGPEYRAYMIMIDNLKQAYWNYIK